jgi:hypothetical protein
MQSGVLYLHGVTKEYSPIVVLDLIKLGELLKKKLIDDRIFCNLHNLIAQYIRYNMLIPG